MKKLLLLVSMLIVSITASAQYAVPQQTSTAMNGQERANLQFAHDWVRDILNRGNLDIASHYMPENFVSHNPNVAGGRDAFVDALRDNPQLIQNVGQTTPEVQFAKNEYVFLMWANFAIDSIEPAHIVKYNTIDLLRIENGKVVEHWDGARKSVTTNFGRKAMGGGVYNHSMNLSATEEDTHRLGQVEFRDILQYGHVELAMDYFDPGYMQHNPNVPGGRDNFMEAFGGRPSRPLTGEWVTPPTLELISGNYYLKFDERMEDDPGNPGGQSAYYRFDMVRVDDGLIQEHWDVATPPFLNQ